MSNAVGSIFTNNNSTLSIASKNLITISDITSGESIQLSWQQRNKYNKYFEIIHGNSEALL
jgi:hypothetical protein